MARPPVTEYIAALFAPFVAAAGNPPWSAELKTAPIPENRRDTQYRRFAKIEEFGGPPVSLAGDQFICRFRHHEGSYLCIGIEGLNPSEILALRTWADSQQLTEVAIDETTVLFLAYYASSKFKPRSTALTESGALEIIDIIDDDYNGHEIFDLVKHYQDFLVFEIPKDNRFLSVSKHSIACNLSSQIPVMRSSIITDDLAGKILRLSELPNVNPENLYFCLTTNHWKYAAIEIYKCLEAAFYLPWTKGLRDAISHEMSALQMARECKLNLQWREKEKDSLIRVLEMLPTQSVIREDIVNLESFSGLPENASHSAIGTRIYKIRNQIVHQYDYDSPEPIYIPDSEWPIISAYLSDIVYELYSTNSSDMAYEFYIS